MDIMHQIHSVPSSLFVNVLKSFTESHITVSPGFFCHLSPSMFFIAVRLVLFSQILQNKE